MNKYELEHVVADHPRMTRAQWQDIYREAWDLYYTPEHMQVVLRRAAACGVGISHLMGLLLIFSRSVVLEKVHPLQAGLFRRKYRHDRRYGWPIEPIWKFYPQYAAEIVTKHVRGLRHWMMLDRMRRRVRKDPNRHAYMDQALTPVADDETESLELFTHNDGARAAVVHARHIAAVTGSDSSLRASSAG